MEDIMFFGSADRKKKLNPETNEYELDPNGRITSQRPAWMHEFQMDDIQETIARNQRELDRGMVPLDRVVAFKENMNNLKNRLDAIEKARPRLSDEDKDKMYKVYTKLGKVIGDRDNMFTYSEMQLGTASPHEEADRMVKKRIPIEDVGMTPKMLENLNIRHEKGKISRDDASQAFKVYGYCLGEPTNVETLRKDSVTARTSRKK